MTRSVILIAIAVDRGVTPVSLNCYDMQLNDNAQGSDMSTLQIEQIPVLSDNYIYIIFDPESQACACVDPADSAAVKRFLDKKGWRLTHILNTHHHNDHVGGNLALKQAYECEIIGAGHDANRIPGIDRHVTDGEVVPFGSTSCQVINVPGHTSGHIAYWFDKEDALFCGDTLFALGCGRLFEGTPAQMWDSLSKFVNLPDETAVYCAHEYTQANAAFAITIDPQNKALQQRMKDIDQLRADGKPTVPTTIGLEKETNPFLRPEDQAVQNELGMYGNDVVAVFAEIRHRKDNF